MIVVLIIWGTNINNNNSNIDMFKINIKTNSYNDSDLKIGYMVKDLICDYLSDELEVIDTVNEAEEFLKINKRQIEDVVNNYLDNNNYNYKSVLDFSFFVDDDITNSQATFNEGCYNITISLGFGIFDCCSGIIYSINNYKNNQKINNNTIYKSRIAEIIKR